MNIKKGIVYVFIANVINLLISLFTGFVVPKILSIETYANIKLFQLYITYIGILHLGFADGMYLRIGGKEIEKLDRKEILEEFKTFKIFQFVVAIIAIIISICIKNEILLLCSIVILPINIANYLKQVYQAIGQFKKYSNFTNVNTILIFMVNIFLLFIVKTDYYLAYIFGYIVVYVFYWILIENETKKLFGLEKAKANRKYLVQDIQSGFFLMIGNFCNVIFTSIDRLFIQNLLGIAQFAYYSFAVSVENLMNVFITPISTVMYNYFCNNKEKEKVINVKKYIVLFSSAIIVVIFPAKFVVDVWLTKYKSALEVLFLLFAAQYISIMIRCVHVNLYKAEKKQKKYFKIMIIVVAISIILDIIAYNISRTINAIAIATLITNIIWFIIGEFEFENYRLKIKDYIYTFLIIIAFLICGLIQNAVIGILIYNFIVLILVMSLEKQTVTQVIVEIKKEIKVI